VTQHENTQIGHVVTWTLLIAAVVVAIGAVSQASSAREISLGISVLLLITIALFYKLTIKIDDQTLLASFGIGLIKKKVPLVEIIAGEPIRIRWWYGWGDSSDAVRLAL
jgi:hypothetical protein